MGPKRYTFSVIVLSIIALTIVAAWSIVADPYWGFRDNPLWLSDRCSSSNPLLNTKTRFAKALKAVMLEPSTVLLGSSRVYRGLDPSMVDGGNAYNLGISSLRAFEASQYIDLMLSTGSLNRVVWGLDFFSFDGRILREVGFDPKLSTWLAPQRIILTALLSVDAVVDAWKLLRGKFGYSDRDGCWMENGLKITNERSGKLIAHILERERQSDYLNWQPGEEHYKAFERSIRRLTDANVRVILFISPIHIQKEKSIYAVGKKKEYDEWRSRVVTIARKYDVDLWDFTRNNPYRESSLNNGSNQYYIDASHYQPRTLGKWILERIGVTNATEEVPKIGLRLTRRLETK